MPRLTLQTIKRYRDSVNRVWKAAEALGAKGLAKVPGYKAVERHLETKRPADPLHIHRTKPKTREAWSEERLTRLFASPIYRGCASADRRWMPGKLILRDALYWVPLIVETLGTRIREVLELRRSDLELRNGILCLRIDLSAEKRVKTEDRGRVVPIPQLLLDLGFAEWIGDLPEKHGGMLFPEIADRAGTRPLSDTFCKVRTKVWKHLGLTDREEDCYALRKTFQSMLEANDVSEGRREPPRVSRGLPAVGGRSHGMASKRDAAEARERAARMVGDHASGRASRWAAIRPVAPKIGCTASASGPGPMKARRLTAAAVGPTSQEGIRARGLRAGRGGGAHLNRGSRYPAIRHAGRLGVAGVEPSVGSVGDSYGQRLVRDGDRAVQEKVEGAFAIQSLATLQERQQAPDEAQTTSGRCGRGYGRGRCGRPRPHVRRGRRPGRAQRARCDRRSPTRPASGAIGRACGWPDRRAAR
ncbi:hypothetical protein BCF33_1339 [Hasllibacter halocynthiae]|uniref:Phage integrase family protein n=1 Tax=Hasllibacter halocynthiae TaxID=595589 RepID=A0A2T0XA02_9RHOB|nr:hypothetical protein BCF33_1339 [Hasllibacter halocynthiae]